MNGTAYLNDTLFNNKKYKIIINNERAIPQLFESIVPWDQTETRVQG